VKSEPNTLLYLVQLTSISRRKSFTALVISECLITVVFYYLLDYLFFFSFFGHAKQVLIPGKEGQWRTDCIKLGMQYEVQQSRTEQTMKPISLLLFLIALVVAVS
jgi:hypothetical protein